MVKILVVQTAFLGDVILITPLLRGLHKIFPDAAIDALVRPGNAAALKGNPHLRRVLVFHKEKNKLREFMRLFFELKRERYDIAVTPHSSFTTALLLWLAGVKRRVGYNRWLARHLLTDRMPHGSGVHKTVKICRLLEAFSDEQFDTSTEMFPSEDDKREAEKHIAGDNTIALAPGSVWNTKRWPLESYAALAAMLHDAGYRLVTIGGPDERALCDEMIAASGRPALNLAGRLSITQSAAVLQQRRLLVSNDSGALHIANAVDTPVYAFFGPTVTRYGYYPYRPRDKVFDVELECRPCGSHGHRACPLGHHRCMTQIDPKDVFEAIIANFPPDIEPRG